MGDDVKQNKKVTKRCLDAKILSKLKISRFIEHLLCFEGDFFPAALLVKELKEGVLDGRKWFYYPSDVDHPCDDESAVAEFDGQFPPKEKGWQPSQEEFFIHSHSVIRP